MGSGAMYYVKNMSGMDSRRKESTEGLRPKCSSRQIRCINDRNKISSELFLVKILPHIFKSKQKIL